MPPDLRGIPGAGGGRPGRRSASRGRQFRPPILGDPRRSGFREPRRWYGRRPRAPKVWTPNRSPRQIPWSSVAIAVGFVLLGAFIWSRFWDFTRVHVAIAGITDGDEITLEEAESLDIRVDIADLDLEEGATPTLFFNGAKLDDDSYEMDETGIRYQPPALAEGDYSVALSIGRPILSSATFTWEFTVDDTPPEINVTSPTPPAAICEPVTVTGSVEPDLASVQLDGQDLEVDDDGRFKISFDQPPTEPLFLTAEDQAGNMITREIVVPVSYPSTQAIHVTAAAWGYEPLREHVIELIDAGKVNAVELDLKDEAGIVGYDTDVELAHTIGAVKPEYQLEDAVELFHSKGVRVIGRIVAFRDGPLARWAEQNGKMNYVVLDADGRSLSKYGGFTNVANPDVRQYNIDIALEAVDRGVDEILWDYVRRPEGALAAMNFPGMQIATGDSEAQAVNNTVVGFLAEAAKPLRERCVYQGASLFGVAARNPNAIGQPVAAIARHVDYIAPMLYPSHWVRGEYRVDHPNAQPYDIVHASLADFQDKAAGSGVAFNLWVQDFSIGVHYGPEEVAAQIQAARDLGVDSWLLWNATVKYTADAITPEMVHLPEK